MSWKHKCNKSDVVANLRSVLSNLHWTSRECIDCEWVDHEDKFYRCKVCEEWSCGECQEFHVENFEYIEYWMQTNALSRQRQHLNVRHVRRVALRWMHRQAPAKVSGSGAGCRSSWVRLAIGHGRTWSPSQASKAQIKKNERGFFSQKIYKAVLIIFFSLSD